MSKTANFSSKHLISLADITLQDVNEIIALGIKFSDSNAPVTKFLNDKIVGLLFTKTSTRTRTAFTSGALRLGAYVIPYGPNDLQLNTGESFQDTGNVLAQMINGLVIRTADDPSQMYDLAKNSQMPVINAMSSLEHPTQALADLTTIYKKFGKVDGIKMVYLGEGNNTASALALALAKFKRIYLTLRTPAGYGVNSKLLKKAIAEANANGSYIEERHDATELPTDADIVYTTRWQTTGSATKPANWQETFLPFQITEDTLSICKNATFMHDLPAHRGEEVKASVIDGARSIVIEQAQFKMYSAMAVLTWAFST